MMHHAAPRLDMVATRVSPEIRLVAVSAVTLSTSTICLHALSTHHGETECEMIAGRPGEATRRSEKVAGR